MPNMFGGDQFDPSYMPRGLDDDECHEGGLWYRVHPDGRVTAQRIDGSSFLVLLDHEIPSKLRELAKKRRG